MNVRKTALGGFLAGIACLLATGASAQTREQGPWWPSRYGAGDQAGASNRITPQKILEALQIPKTGKTYELGHPYEPAMPKYGERPYFLQLLRREDEDGVAYTEYFTGYIGQMGTQFDALGHQGKFVQMADGSRKAVFYNGFTEEEMTRKNRGLGGLEALGTETIKPFITRGILIDIAGYKSMASLPAAYEVTVADVRGALARQGMSEASIREGDAVLFNYGWSVNWTNPSKYNDNFVGRGENKGSPGIFTEVAKWLVDRRISVVGADSCCLEARPIPTEGNVHHDLFLAEGITMIENMELKELANDKVYEFLLLALPERIKGATGSPIRPMAIR